MILKIFHFRGLALILFSSGAKKMKEIVISITARSKPSAPFIHKINQQASNPSTLSV